MKPLLAIGTFVLSGCIVACSNSDSTTITPSTGSESVNITSVVQSQYKSAVTVSTSGNSVILKSNGLPDHKTPYWGVGNALYEDFPTGYHANVNTSMSLIPTP